MDIFDEENINNYYLENVDVKELEIYCDEITEGEGITSINSPELMQKMEKIKKENEKMKIQINSLDKANKKLKKDNYSLKQPNHSQRKTNEH